ncbi:MAG: hypothetical protein OM95_02930 [Bdellovibrio sp. ArHS]|uniref:hypothetical protein n=1 Tax=Bdellovibrio sp. ArHS TaxID=1569284 RepID=UPI00058396B7|nr:hypothetical protein [Bdellovibrio sp. ArHS]KHD89550.1 MAG: hypothetical protein OM95_02930 [Bdellovibrio sp. ArHS]
MKKAKFVKAEQIAFEEVSDSYAAIKFGDEKFVIDMDTLYDLTFRAAAFLTHLEERADTVEAKVEKSPECACKQVH